MSRNHIKYIFEDVKLGLKRNRGSAIASISLLFIALSLIGFLLLTRAFVQDAVDYVESQLAMKVYVEDGLLEDVSVILSKQSYVQEIEIETGEEMIEGLAFFFHGKEHLLDAFRNGPVADAIKFQVTDKTLMPTIAEKLETTAGITKVVYPQQMAEILSEWIGKIEMYGILSLAIFFGLAFIMVYITFHLAIYQRNRELQVKLFLGINPQLLRLQFLVEGLVLGITGAVFAIIVTISLYMTVFNRMQQAFPYVGQLKTSELIIVMIIQFVIGVFLSLVASYLSTRKLIEHV